MKKHYKLVMTFIVVVLVLLSVISQTVQAKVKTKDSSQGIAIDAWEIYSGTGTSYNISSISSEAPTWLQLMSGGIKLKEPSKICHPLRGGQFGWVGEIRQYKNNQWLKLTTVNDWVPNKEGVFMSCTEAPQAGIYALFGYFIRPVGYVENNPVSPTPSFDCSSLTWTVYMAGCVATTCDFYGSVTSVPNNTLITMTVDSDDSVPTSLSGSGSTTTNSVGNYYRIVIVGGIPTSITIDYALPAYGCTYRYEHAF
jgi:hypothetical protein